MLNFAVSLRPLLSHLRVFKVIYRPMSAITATADYMSLEDYVKILYSSEKKRHFTLFLSGGGASAASSLLTVPGASSCVTNIQMPYSRDALVELLSKNLVTTSTLPSFCSFSMSTLMAIASYRDAVRLSITTKVESSTLLHHNNVFGVSCTAALVSDQPKRGEHRCYVSIANSSLIITYSLLLEKGKRTRVEEDTLCTKLVLHAIGKHIGLQELPLSEVEGGDQLQVEHNSRDLLSAVCSKESALALYFPRDNTSITEWTVADDVVVPPGSIIFSGSFNPLHDGHVGLALAAAKRQLQSQPQTQPIPLIVFEIAAVNADKPPIAADILLSRLQQFNDPSLALLRTIAPVAVAITSEPLFTRKAAVFPHAHFVIGADTLTRLFDLKYYSGGIHGLVKAMSAIDHHGCSFIVGGRVQQGKDSTVVPAFQTMESIFADNESAQIIFQLWPEMFKGISAEAFRSDLSSTAIRNAQQQKLIEK